MSWHVPDETLRAYVAGRIGDADAWSVEAHLTSCERCRRVLADATTADTGRAAALATSWADVARQLPEQGAVRTGSRWREARMLVAAGPAARWAWLAACALVLVLAAALGAGEVMRTPWLGVIAPVVPLLGVAVSYGSGLDDAYEVIASTPGGGLRLLLVRSAAVLAVTTPVAMIAGAVTGYGSPVPWLLACLALTLLTLAIGSAIGVARAAVVVGLAWLVGVGGVVVDPSTPTPVLLTVDAAPGLLAASAVAMAVVAIRRGSFNELRVREVVR